ncbi:MAG: aspartate dehydrogenase [Ardenticatenaceae bacterium]|nr:aspartate dehydrogenase [Ardenticatenaceae bacterium]
MIKLGLIGCGAIGSAVVNAILEEEVPNVRLVGILSLSSNEVIDRAQRLLGTHFAHTIEELIELAPDMVVEAAGQPALKAYARSLLAAGIDVLPMSVGALADPDFLADLVQEANRKGGGLLIPSGAIGALDVLRSGCAAGEVDELILTSTKRPAALRGAPYLIEHGISLEGIQGPVTVFDGPAAQACNAFPESINIGAAVSLAGLGFERTRIRIVADPNVPRTTHSLRARGAFGELQLTLRSSPHPDNPRTSYLACLGAIAAIKNSRGPLRFV